jgi:hypothetical protein
MHFLFGLRRVFPLPAGGFSCGFAGLLAFNPQRLRHAGGNTGIPVRLDDTPRIAVMSAFEPELTLLLAQLQTPRGTASTASTSPPARCRASRSCCFSPASAWSMRP